MGFASNCWSARDLRGVITHSILLHCLSVRHDPRERVMVKRDASPPLAEDTLDEVNRVRF